MPPRMALEQKRERPTHSYLPPRERLTENIIQIPNKEPKRENCRTSAKETDDGLFLLLGNADAGVGELEDVSDT